MTQDVLEFAGQRLNLPPTERGRARWRKIIETAERLFVERGYANVTLSTIVAESGGSLQTVYKWFGNKDKLFFAIHSVRIDDVQKMIATATFEGESVEEGLSFAIDSMTKNTPFHLMRVVLFESGAPTQYESEFLSYIESKINASFVSFFRRLRERYGVEYIVSDEETALVFIRYFRGFALEIALGAKDAQERLESGKRLLKRTMLALVKTSEGA